MVNMINTDDPMNWKPKIAKLGILIWIGKII